MGPLNTDEERFLNKYTKALINQEIRNLRKTVLASKVVNPFTCASSPLLYGEEGTFTFRDYPRI
jgi:hypothetical protein